MPERHANTSNYRYGFNGKELDNEIKGEGLHIDYGFRVYDPRIGKFLSTDPLFQSYPYFTPYQFAGNNPIWAIDLDGLEQLVTNKVREVQNFQILDSNLEPLKGVKDVVYYDTRRGKLVREYRESGTYVLNEGYEGGPQRIEDITLIRTNRLAPDLNGTSKFRILYKFRTKMTPIPATKPPPPPPPYDPDAKSKDDDTSAIDTETDTDTDTETEIIKSGTTISLDESKGQFYGTIDHDGIDFVSFTDGTIPAENVFKSLIEKINKNPDIHTVKLSIVFSHWGNKKELKEVRRSVIWGLRKLDHLFFDLGLRSGVKFEIDYDNLDIYNPGESGRKDRSVVNMEVIGGEKKD